MALRRSSATKLKTTRDQALAEIEAVEEELRAANIAGQAARREIAADEKLGEIDSATAIERRLKIEADLSRLRERLVLLREALPALEVRLVDEDEQRRIAQIEARRKDLAKAIEARRGAETGFRRAVVSASKAADELERHRHLVADALDALEELLVDDEPGAPQNYDETWEPDGLESLRTLLEGGPVRPLAAAAAAAGLVAEGNARRDQELLRWFAAWPLPERLSQLPVRLKDSPEARAAEAAWDAKVEEQKEARRKREGQREVARL